MNLPEDFTAYTREWMGEDLFADFMKGMEATAPTSIRLNPFKCPSCTHITDEDDTEVVPWCPNTGRYLSERRNFTFDPLLHAGLYYVQEASSMFIDLAIRKYVKQPVRMLDLCAAPGGKSTCAMSALPEGSMLFSNEPIRPRAMVLAENITKFGKDNMVVTNNYPADYKKAKMVFDAIIADVPCSGEGMFRKDEGAIAEWSTDNVEKCRNLQREIVSDIWSCLKPGGIMVYSTCTFNAHEDEENAEWIAKELGADFIEVETAEEWNITPALCGNLPAYRFIPGISKGEGLFMTILRKHGDTGKADSQRDLLKAAEKRLKIIANGIKAPEIKGKQIIPDHSEAMSIMRDKAKYPTVDIDYAQAIAYLRHEAITLDASAPRGIVLLTYKDVPLGFAKNLGNRANNLYPAEWRIKSTHIPADFSDIISWQR